MKAVALLVIKVVALLVIKFLAPPSLVLLAVQS